MEVWQKEVFCRDREKPDFEKFIATYGEFIPRVQYEAGHIAGKDLMDVIGGMSKQVLGLDGWRVAELKSPTLASMGPANRA